MVRRKRDVRNTHVTSPMGPEGAEWSGMDECEPTWGSDSDDADTPGDSGKWQSDTLVWSTSAHMRNQESAEASGESSFLGLGALHTLGAVESSQASGEKGKRVSELALGYASSTRAESRPADHVPLDEPLDADLDDGEEELTEPDDGALDDVYLLQEGPMAVDPLDPTKDAWRIPGPEDEL